MIVDPMRRLIVALPFAAGICGVSACSTQIAPAEPTLAVKNPDIAAIERNIGGRIGVALMDKDGALLAQHRGQEQFAMCSTFKAPLAAALLAAHDRGEVDRFAEITVSQDDLVPYAPFVERLIAKNQTTNLDALAEKIVDYSDNAATNIILRALGGPSALTEFFRANGGDQTRLDRYEPDLNENAVGDPRDTTTPISMTALMGNILIKHSIGRENADILGKWMVSSSTGDTRIEAGLPKTWKMGDKTGTAPSSAPAFNDIAIIWPQSDGRAGRVQMAPVILAIYVDRSKLAGEKVDAAIADITRLLMPVTLAQG